ncbi:MAG: ATP-binding cassette domain-containing protein [Candidatus Aminicenantes bacterium]|nr:ATP-binding cassette domain-containing protein [Candidatus Aminicenantes bacterium]NIM83416.1 ATP-binding cassette domain-containing protein [Candidatus Aminicenantes bacterium]NIN24687.1 ATP-binding cassette domain-containing protein [Candidatus Aminicenantes bacterium]NIN48448.1 ATP-binding cassette domain-containing protein [Candidatus Aminicenantes bacterium]NIN91345.1 ATP-binding cassette domain-containing protein [Candidatus Aminicenantes bacterium]
MVKLEHVNKSFGEIAAVEDVSIEIPASRITIITGADGAGKSTLFKMMVGLVRKDSGDIFLKGENIDDDYRKMTAVTGYMPERFSLYPDLSVEENLNFFADIHQVPFKKREERKQRMLEKTGMLPFKGRRAGALSGGMKQKLSLSCILLSAPEFIILDEPTTGVDPLSRIEFFNIIKELKAEGKTIAMSTPYLDEAEQGDYIVFLKDGKIIKKDTIEQLKKNFPAKLFKILPRGNIFDIMKSLEHQRELRDNLYIRGKYIKYLQTGRQNHIDLIPHVHVEEEEPKLEDIYIYYERQESAHVR